MKRFQHLYFPILNILMLAMASCGSESGIDDETYRESEGNFVAYTRNDDSEERTYRVFAYDANSLNATGTYKGIPGQPMMPCKLNSDGSIDMSATSQDHIGSQVDWSSFAYWLCISPGMAFDGYNLEIRPSESDILMSNISTWTINPDFKLYERRARIIFNVSVGDNNTTVNEIELEDIVVKGVGDPDVQIFYKPRLNQVDNEDLTTSVRMADASPADRPKTKYSSVEPLYAISAVYAPKDIVKKYIVSSMPLESFFNSQYISAELTMQIGGKGEVSISQLLTQSVVELKPMHEYTYNFTINTEYVNVTLNVCDCGSHTYAWQQENSVDGEQHIGDIGSSFVIDLGKWKIGDDNGWTPAISEDQII